MQREVLAILEQAVSAPRWLTPDEVLAQARGRLKTRPTSAAIVR